MSSSRLILIFLGFIFLIIVILSSSRIAATLRKSVGNIIPGAKSTIENITPTPTIKAETITPTPTVIISSNKGGTISKGGITSGEIPATGPNDLLYLVLGGSVAAGIALKKLSIRSLQE